MPPQSSDLNRAKRGVAILAACIVQTMNDSDPSFRERFLTRLRQTYQGMRDDDPGETATEELELLSWTMEFLSGFKPLTEQRKPLGM